jgi:hypothetical protein
MLDPMSAHDRTDDNAAPLLDELLQVVPRLVERTRSQAEFARSIAALLPCVGGLVARRSDDVGPGVPEHERVDVLSVLGDDEPGDADLGAEQGLEPEQGPPEAALAEPAAEAGPPLESELPIQDYDSLAASQVVPRLATLTPDELRAVQHYERATRNRQTILNRVDQLLSS